MAQESDQAESVQAPEIVVTAQFRAQNLQDTPIAITAVNAEMLEARGQTNVQDIAAQAPNVTLKAGGASFGPSLIGFIRGVGQTDFSPAMEPGVGLYVDDVYYSTVTGSLLDLLDLERVEVLRGPQGTLAGKNSIGGSIKLYSKKPAGDDSGFVEAGYGSYDLLTFRGAVDFAVTDKLFVRLAGTTRHRDGYVTRLDYGCTHPGSGLPVTSNNANCVLGTEGGVNYTAARLALRWMPIDGLEINIAADVLEDQSEAPANTLLNVAPTLFNTGIDTDGNPFTGQQHFLFGSLVPAGYDIAWYNTTLGFPTIGAGNACRFIAYGANSCDPNSPNNAFVNYSTYGDPRAAGTGTLNASGFAPSQVPAEQTLKSRGASINIDLDLAGNLQLQSITAYRWFVAGFGDDQDGTPLPVQMDYQRIRHRQWSQELRLNGELGTRLDYTLGGFYFDQRTAQDSRISIPYAGPDFLQGPDPVPSRTAALFAHADVHLTQKANLTLGLRYTDEKKSYTFARHNPDGSDVCTGTLNPFTFAPYNCGLIGLDGQSASFKGSRVDYRVALSYAWTKDFMTYAQFSTGFKGGGINPRPFNPRQILTFDAETLKAYEVGFKSQHFDRKLRLNAAVFINKYSDIQLLLTDCTALLGFTDGVPCVLPANTGDAEVRGAEVEFDLYPVDGLQLDGSAGYLDFGYTRVDPSTGVPKSAVSPYSPKWRWSLGAQYEIDLGSVGSLTPRFDAAYQGEVFAAATNSPDSRIAPYTLVNGHLTWRSKDRDFQVSLEVRNLTNKFYFLTKLDGIPAFLGFASGQPGLPRTWSVSARKSF